MMEYTQLIKSSISTRKQAPDSHFSGIYSQQCLQLALGNYIACKRNWARNVHQQGRQNYHSTSRQKEKFISHISVNGITILFCVCFYPRRRLPTDSHSGVQDPQRTSKTGHLHRAWNFQKRGYCFQHASDWSCQSDPSTYAADQKTSCSQFIKTPDFPSRSYYRMTSAKLLYKIRLK